VPTTVPNAAALRLQLFDFLFAGEHGQICIAIGNATKSYFRQHFFRWPDERTEAGTFIEHNTTKFNVWFSVTLFSRPERGRAYAVAGSRIWADLDEVDPLKLDHTPNIVLETSPGRYQGFWQLQSPVPPEVAQDLSMRLAYHIGADKSGWDLEQLLRVPYTFNHKYIPPSDVKVLRMLHTLQPIDWFDSLPIPNTTSTNTNGDVPVLDDVAPPGELPELSQVLYSYRQQLNNPNINQAVVFKDLREREPADSEDWSGRSWRLINICFEFGMNEHETFVIAESAACNKYHRDNRPISYMWREVLKASAKHVKFTTFIGSAAKLIMPTLVDDIEEDSFVAEYKSWANDATDAPEQYHELSCFIALSAVLSNGLSLSLEYNENFRPNLWGLLLGDSTLSRKTTCMNMAMDLITDLDRDLILASDGSAEGLLSGIAGRPKRVSIFLKDEVSGFFDSINRKDYLAGFPETLTKLYDVPKVLPRLLRKETITVVEPYFIFFGGGIRDRVYSLITDDYILSGFIPRFLVVSSENDITRIRRT